MKIGKLEKVDLRTMWTNEARDFTCWIERNIEQLSDFLGFELQIIEREKKVGSFSIDLYAEANDGEKVIIENQLEKTDHTHLGQIVTYFTNLEAKHVIWIAKDIRPEHAQAINWLNQFTGISFYLLQVEAYKIGDSDPAPYFKLVCKPNETIKAIGQEIKDFNDREKFNVRFWESMIEKCKSRLSHFTTRKASKYHYHSGSAGKGGFTFVFLATNKFYGVELYIDLGNEDENLFLIQYLAKSKNQIEKEFGHELSWEELHESRACRIRFHIAEESILEVDQSKAQEEMITCMERFEKVLRPKIKELPNYNAKAA
jgi:hypothetical protein